MTDTGISPREWELLSLEQPEAGPSRSSELGSLFVKADYKAVLQSPDAQAIFSNIPSLWTGLLPDQPPQQTSSSSSTTHAIVQLVVAISLQHAFVQLNWTGPALSINPSDLVPSSLSQTVTDEDLNSAALPHLTLGGEPAYHLAHNPTFLLLSIRLLKHIQSTQEDVLGSIPWWLLRSHLIHQSLLDEPVAISDEALSEVKSLLELIPEEERDMKGSLHIELGLYYNTLGNDKLANQEFILASECTGLKYELTGALGKKTKFQLEDHSQLVLLAESRSSPGEPSTSNGGDNQEKGSKGDSKLPEALLLNDDTLLEETAFTKTSDPSTTSTLSHLDPANQPPLNPIDQALLLCLCLSTQNSSPSDGLLTSQMMPFITRVITHPRNWSIHTTALILRSRLEAIRSRTVERSVLQLSALIEQMPSTDSTVPERLKYFHQIPLPSKWEMERELAKRYLTVGVTRSALEIFGRLEMWEEVVGCLQRLDREEEALKIVNDLLEGKRVESDLVTSLKRSALSDDKKVKMGTAREGKLWCLLGDILLSSEEMIKVPEETRNKVVECYDKAWEISEKSSSRSRRSLGSLLVGQSKFEEAIPVLKDALRINPLYPRVWFTLGVCFVRLEKFGEARDAFKRQVSVDEEDGEGWNNLAAVYLRLGEKKETSEDTETKTVTFDNKLSAYRALKTGLRFSPSNWRMWANYMLISIDVGELSESARAMSRLLQESPNAFIDIDVLDKLVDSVTRDDYNNGTPLVPPTTSNEGYGLLPILERLFDNSILPKISNDPRIWKSHARLLRWKEDWVGAMDDYLKAYRVGIVSDDDTDRNEEKFKESVREIEELIGVLEVLGPKAKLQKEKEGKGTKGDWKFTAKGIVRTFMGRTKDSFEGTAEWEKLGEMLEDLKAA